MKKLIIILSLSTNICLGQQTLDDRFTIDIFPVDSVYTATPYKDKTKRDSIADTYSNWYQRARALEKYLLAIENPGVRRNKNDQIVIKLLTGKTVTLVPDVNAEESDFTFEKHFKELKLLLFRVQWSEGNNYAIIDLENGHKTYTIGQPFFSPDLRFMMAINCDFEAGYSNNGFELFEIVNRNFKALWRYDPTSWGPVELKWIEGTTIVSKNQAVDASTGKAISTYTKIKLTRNVR